MAARKNRVFFKITDDHSAQGVNHGDRLHGVTEKLHPQGMIFLMHRKDLNHITPHPKGTPMEGELVALIEHKGQPPQDLFHGIVLAHPEEEVHVFVFIG